MWSFTPVILLLCATALASLPSSVEAGGVKGWRNVASPSSNMISPTRNLKKSKKGKRRILGPQSRNCKVSEKSDEVNVSCRSGDGGSKDSKDKKGSKDSRDAGDNGRPSFSSNDEERVQEEDLEGRGITISPENIEDEIKYKVKTTDKGIRVEIEYEQEVKTEDLETETETKFKLLFESLVEYVKSNGSETGVDDEDENSQAFDWDRDEIIQSVPLASWDAIPGIMNDSEGVVSYFTASTTSGPKVGSVAFNFTISRATRDERLTSNSMKIDVLITDFPWTRSDSYVALLSTIESKKKVEMEYDDDATISRGKSRKVQDVVVLYGDDSVEEALGFSAFGEYSWLEAADAQRLQDDANCTSTGAVAVNRQAGFTGNSNCFDVTREKIQVVATSPQSSEDGAQSIAYSFIGSSAQSASEIYWDPSVGTAYEMDSGSYISSLGYAGGIIGVILCALW